MRKTKPKTVKRQPCRDCERMREAARKMDMEWRHWAPSALQHQAFPTQSLLLAMENVLFAAGLS